MRHRLLLFLCTVFIGALASSVLSQQAASEKEDQAQEEKETPTIASATEACERYEGLLTFHTDSRKGKLWLELPPATGERGEIAQFIYVESLFTGLGSNPVGLDRGQLGPSRLVTFRRVGGRILIEQENLAFRALSENQDERRAVRQSFASSVLWAGEIEVEDPDGRLLVDLTSFVVRDAHHVAATLKRSQQGDFKLDEKRSAIDLQACLAFPDNIEFEAVLTFSGSEPGRFVRSTAPTPQAITLIQHHSLIRLPDDQYQPRNHDPRVGCFATQFMDYAASLDEPLMKRWIRRHRLEKTNPNAARSPVIEPIIYYVDRGAPEPVRSALIDGGNWWAQAFEEAGFIDAFRVELMPAGAHPLDVRYNVVQWVHRSTRGWSYGSSVYDPRTGEIIKGHVSLGSLRVRQDRLIFEGLAGTEHTGTGRADDPVQLALARIRQLAAHEIGHTLGFAHNFAASTYAGRASVMDYPAPLISIRAGDRLDFSNVYDEGIGEWDIHTVRYAYSVFPQGVDEDAALKNIVLEGLKKGYLFLSDNDARPLGSAHPAAHLWDNGDDPAAELEKTLKIRRIALQQFGERNIQPGRPLALLHEVLTPLYLHHRYQLVATIKTIGGLNYSYALRGDGQPESRPIEADQQRRALQAALACISPEVLDVPESVLNLILPRPFGYSTNREMFDAATAPVFDALGAAETAASMTVRGILQPERCARLIDFNRRDDSQLSLEQVIEAVIEQAFQPMQQESARLNEIRRLVQQVVVVALIDLGLNETVPARVRVRTDRALRDLQARIARSGRRRDLHFSSLIDLIDRYLNRQISGQFSPARARSAPPGSPIGLPSILSEDDWCGWSSIDIDSPLWPHYDR